jgi:hypothetical protein
MTEPPSLETRLRQLRASHRDGQGGSDCSGVNTGDCDTCDTLEEAAERIVSLHQRIAQLQADIEAFAGHHQITEARVVQLEQQIAWTREKLCRPNPVVSAICILGTPCCPVEHLAAAATDQESGR